MNVSQSSTSAKTTPMPAFLAVLHAPECMFSPGLASVGTSLLREEDEVGVAVTKVSVLVGVNRAGVCQQEWTHSLRQRAASPLVST